MQASGSNAHLETEYDDQHQNHVYLISIDSESTSVTVTTEIIAETCDSQGMLGPHTGPMPLWCFRTQTTLTQPGSRLKALVSAFEVDPGDGYGRAPPFICRRFRGDQV